MLKAFLLDFSIILREKQNNRDTFKTLSVCKGNFSKVETKIFFEFQAKIKIQAGIIKIRLSGKYFLVYFKRIEISFIMDLNSSLFMFLICGFLQSSVLVSRYIFF